MPDIPDKEWVEYDDRNTEPQPNGWPGGMPAYIDQIGRMMMGAIKRSWRRSNPYYRTTGTGDDYVVDPEISYPRFNNYEVLRLRIDRANVTASPTLTFGEWPTAVIRKVSSGAIIGLSAGDLVAGADQEFWYDGTQFILSNPGTLDPGISAGLLHASANLSDVSSIPQAKVNLGLGNVDNTSDANKPVSSAQQAALNLKANLASPTFAGTPAAPTPAAADNSTTIATTAFVKTAVGTVLTGATSDDTFADTDELIYLTGSTSKRGTLTGLISSIFAATRKIANAQFLTGSFRLFDTSAPTKGLAFDVSAVTPGQTRNVAFQDRDITVGMVLVNTGTLAFTPANDFAVPAGPRRIVLLLGGFSTNGTSVPMIQLMTGGVAETSGYSGAASNTASTTGLANTAGFNVNIGNSAATVYDIQVEAILRAGNTWSVFIKGASSLVVNVHSGGGKTLAGALSGLRLVMANGTDIPDAGGFSYYVEY